jgi:hypothetical protein
MNTKITFNSKTSPYATTDKECNLLFIRCYETYCNDILKARGYIYLNTIYELFGVKWNPEWENLCMLYKPDVTLRVAIRCVNEDGFDFDII